MIKTKFYKYLYLAPLVLFIYMPFHVFISTWLSSVTGGLEFWRLWKDFLTVATTLIFIALVLYKNLQNKLYLWLVGLTTLYGLVHLVMLLVKDLPQDVELLASAYNLRIFAYTIIGFSLVLLLPKAKLLKKYSNILILVSTVVCLLAFLQWLLPKDILTDFGYAIDRGVKPNFFIDDKPDLPRLFSTLRDPNSLGAFLILPIILILQNLMRVWKTPKRNFFAGLLMLHVLILFLTFSRSTLLATILAVGLLLVFQYRKLLIKYKKQLSLYFVGFVIVLLGIFIATKDSYFTQNIVFHADESTSLEDPNELRLRFLAEGVEGVADEPLGSGPGSAGLVSTRLGQDVVLTENYFLQIAYEVGIMGFAVFIGLLYLIIKNLWDRRKEPIVVALLASFVGLVFANMLFHTWANEAVAISWFLLAGLALAGKETSKSA